MSAKKNISVPNEWADDQVMDVLFSPFRGNREVNPRSWDSKMKFWTDMIRNYCEEKKTLTVNAKDLSQVFERNGRVPSCLNVVLDDLKRRGSIMTLSDFYAGADPSWLSWSVNWFVRKPVRWSYNNVVKRSVFWAYGMVFGREEEDSCRPKSKQDTLPDEQLVFVDLVKVSAEKIYQRHNDSVRCEITDSVVAYSALQANCQDICSNEQSFHVAVQELIRQKLCTVTTCKDGERLIRMGESVEPMSEADEKIHRMKAAVKLLEDDKVKICSKMERCRQTAKVFLKQGKQQEALKCLKQKQMLTKTLEKRDQAIDNINALLTSIQESESQKQIYTAYKSGVEAFKEITRKHDLNESKIDDTMLEIQEVFDSNQQINEAMSHQIDAGLMDVSDSDLEEELDEILRERPDAPAWSNSGEAVTPEAAKPPLRFGEGFDLPEVPQHEPTFIPLRPERPVTEARRSTTLSFQ